MSETMRFVHISDLHLGKRLCGRSFADDQRYILDEIVRISEDEKADAVLIAGDVFDDGNNMTSESVSIFDEFITALSKKGIKAFIVSGNHDSMERLDYGSRLFRTNGVYIAGDFDGNVRSEDIGDVTVYMIPFLKPALVRKIYNCEADTYEDALSEVLAHIDLDESRKNILITHQYVIDGEIKPKIRDSERSYVGGTECVRSSLFDKFDYVALGHIHSPQSIGRENVRYCGTPLKYSLSEKDDTKSITVVDVGDDVSYYTIPLKPKRELVLLEGTLDAVLNVGREGIHKDDYVYIRLSDQNLNDVAKLSEVFSNLMEVGYVASESDTLFLSCGEVDEAMDLENELQLFFKNKTGKEMNDVQKSIVKKLFEEAGVNE